MMRNEICKTLIKYSKNYPMVFLTGDLGFMALEPLRDALQDKFVNAGISEQNMVTVAAGLAYAGYQPWVYSIAPFCYARPFEQIRNDVCFNKLAVKIVGNGGGYAYGSMGSTHHALEDYGILSTLPNMQIFIPAFASDIDPIVRKMSEINLPSYLRLGRCELPVGFKLPEYDQWRKLLLGGTKNILLGIGPLIGGIIGEIIKHDSTLSPTVWCISELPLKLEAIPREFLQNLAHAEDLYIVEEHVAAGSVGQSLIWLLQTHGIKMPNIVHRTGLGYLSGNYGSQTFHRHECGLDSQSIIQMLGIH